MPFDLNTTATMLKAVEAMPMVCSFLYDTLCKDAGVTENDKAIYDYRKGQQQMAPFVTPGVGGVEMSRSGFETREVDFCTIAPQRTVNAHDIATRSFGEKVLGGMTPEQRSRKMLAADLVELRNAVQRRREWMSMQMATTGKLEIFTYTNEGRNKNATMVLDCHFTNNFTPTTKWNESGAKILSDMRKMDDMVYEGGGYVDIKIMDAETAEAMLYNESYMKQLDNRNVKAGEIEAKYNSYGVRYWGKDAHGTDIYSVSGKYLDDDRTLKPILPKGTILTGYRGMLKVLHGPVTLVENDNANQHTTYIKREVPDRVASKTNNSIANRLTSCPIIIPENIDGWVVGHVL